MIIKKHYSCFLLFLLLNTNNAWSQYVWTQKANYGGGGVYDPFVFVVGTQVYSGSGIGAGHVYLNDFWVWDQSTNIWTQKTDFPGAGRYGPRAFTIGSNGYVTFGYSAGGFVNDVWEYNTVTNIWTQKNSFPATARYTGFAFSLYSKGYFGTGNDFGNAYFSDLWQYDALADSWTQVADFPGTARGATSMFIINNEAYVGLGSNVEIDSNYVDFYKYNPISNSWSRVADFPGLARNCAYSFTINDTGYIVCGYNYTLSFPSNIYKDFWAYDAPNNSWKQLSDFPGGQLFEGIYCNVGVYGYIGVGCDTANNSYAHYTNIYWQYGPSGPAASFQSSNRIFCQNSCVNYTDQSVNATSWQWLFPGAWPDTSTQENPQNICYFSPGSYNVTQIVSNDSISDTLTFSNYITVNPTPPPPLITQDGNTLICSTDPSYISYQWFFNDSIIAGATDTFYVSTRSGNYNTEVTNKNGCSIAVGINVVLGINEEEANNYFIIYPNPVSDALIISISKNFHNANAEIFDMLGRKLIQMGYDSPKGNILTIDLKNFAQGAYFISVIVDGKRMTKKILKINSLE